jgi:tripartite-type tricarboxylate transporter receptor subunit TctC
MKILSLMLSATTLVASSAMVMADEKYPERPIKIIIPYQAGGGTDVMTRIVVEKVRERTKQPFIIETKPGGNTVIGVKALLAAPPDGYTLLMTSSATFHTAPLIVKDAGYEPLSSFSLINYIAYTPVVFVINSSVPANSLKEFVELAKKKPEGYSLGTYGRQLGSDLFQKHAGFKLNSIPYKGVEAVNAVVAGHVDAMFDGVFTALPYLKQGRTKPLAVMQNQRTRFAPDVPTVTELGYKSMPNIPIWYGLVGPKGMDPQVVAKLSEEFRIALTSPEVVAKLANLSVEAVGSGPEALRGQIQSEYTEYKKIADELGIKPE